MVVQELLPSCSLRYWQSPARLAVAPGPDRPRPKGNSTPGQLFAPPHVAVICAVAMWPSVALRRLARPGSHGAGLPAQARPPVLADQDVAYAVMALPSRRATLRAHSGVVSFFKPAPSSKWLTSCQCNR